MKANLNNTDNNDYVRGYKDGKKAGVTAEADRVQLILDALDQFIAFHESGLLPAKHIYEKAIAARRQFKEGKAIEPVLTEEQAFEKWKKENVTILGEFDFIVGHKRVHGKKELRRIYEYLTNPPK